MLCYFSSDWRVKFFWLMPKEVLTHHEAAREDCQQLESCRPPWLQLINYHKNKHLEREAM